MAWIYANPQPEAVQWGDGKTVDYYTYRTVHGNVEMRLADVSVDGAPGTVWFSPAVFDVQLVYSTGVVLGSGKLQKRWGQPASFTRLKSSSPYASVRMRVTANVTDSAGSKLFVHWKGDLRWGSA